MRLRSKELELARVLFDRNGRQEDSQLVIKIFDKFSWLSEIYLGS